jgi:hypothetical protein
MYVIIVNGIPSIPKISTKHLYTTKKVTSDERMSVRTLLWRCHNREIKASVCVIIVVTFEDV